MQAAVYSAPGEIAIEDRAAESFGDDEILVDVAAASLCGTDVRIFKSGHFKIPTPTRRVLGHEVAGTVAAVGPLVRGLSAGMRVSFTPNIGCGTCEMCRQGFNNMCPDYEAFGISVDGGLQQRMRVPASAIRGGNVFRVPDRISFEEAAMIEPLSCCYNAFKGLGVSPEATLLIIGPGPIGACFAQLGRLWGARKVIVAGRSSARLGALEAFGADILINTATRDLAAEISRITAGRGVDVVVTAASAPELQPLAVELLATHGRVNFFGGLAKGTMVALDTNRVHYRGLTLTGTTGSSNEDYDRAMRLVADGRINMRDLISHRFPLSDIHRAFEAAMSGGAMKTMVLPN